jgi:TfoX/Sxy family transcriptional regulator of competence genes
MTYNTELDDRLFEAIADWGVDGRKMFGGTCYLLNGNMLAGVWKDFLILRLGEEEGTKALQEPFTVPFDITGRPMKGWVMVDERGYQGDDLLHWLKRARAFVETLPAK